MPLSSPFRLVAAFEVPVSTYSTITSLPPGLTTVRSFGCFGVVQNWTSACWSRPPWPHPRRFASLQGLPIPAQSNLTQLTQAIVLGPACGLPRPRPASSSISPLGHCLPTNLECYPLAYHPPPAACRCSTTTCPSVCPYHQLAGEAANQASLAQSKLRCTATDDQAQSRPIQSNPSDCVALYPSLGSWTRFSSSFLSISPYHLHPAVLLGPRGRASVPFSPLLHFFSPPALGTRIHNKTVPFLSDQFIVFLCLSSGLTLDLDLEPAPSTPSVGITTRRALLYSCLVFPKPRTTLLLASSVVFSCSPALAPQSPTCRCSRGAPAARAGWP